MTYLRYGRARDFPVIRPVRSLRLEYLRCNRVQDEITDVRRTGVPLASRQTVPGPSCLAVRGAFKVNGGSGTLFGTPGSQGLSHQRRPGRCRLGCGLAPNLDESKDFVRNGFSFDLVKTSLRLQSGVVVLPVLVARSADQGAVDITQRPHRLNLGGFAVLAQPAVVDLGAGRSHIFRGTRIWGYAFNALIKKKLARYLPDPA